MLFINPSYSRSVGSGDLTLSSTTTQRFIDYLRAKKGRTPLSFWISLDGEYSTYWFCPGGNNCSSRGNEKSMCETQTEKQCALFASKSVVKWKNGTNTGHYKKSSFKRKWSDTEIRAKLTELGFLDGSTSSSTSNKKIKEPKKVVKKYELKGERSIALSWDGYEDLIAGTVEFDEADYKGTLNIPLPNNDGTCDGTYSLQEGGKGTWQIACTNDMGAAGTLKWIENGGVTGTGRDHNDKKVKFTVSKKS